MKGDVKKVQTARKEKNQAFTDILIFKKL